MLILLFREMQDPSANIGLRMIREIPSDMTWLSTMNLNNLLIRI